MLRSLLAVCFYLVSSIGALALTDEELRQLWAKGDLKRMEEVARTGDHRAQAWMGLMLQNRARFGEALKWWTRAAEQGNRWAISMLADMHRRGIGMPKDEGAAVAWYRRGAELGYGESARNLADALLSGLGGAARDPEAARRWLLSSIASGDKYAPARLTRIYADGDGVPRDPVEAYAFAEVASYRIDQSEIAEVERLKSELAAELGADEIRRARARAVEIDPALAAHYSRLSGFALLGFAVLAVLACLSAVTMFAFVVRKLNA